MRTKRHTALLRVTTIGTFLHGTPSPWARGDERPRSGLGPWLAGGGRVVAEGDLLSCEEPEGVRRP
jgi:hypothetical protein